MRGFRALGLKDLGFAIEGLFKRAVGSCTGKYEGKFAGGFWVRWKETTTRFDIGKVYYSRFYAFVYNMCYSNKEGYVYIW